jgi:cytochrome c oxidase cbb3-type subunit 3
VERGTGCWGPIAVIAIGAVLAGCQPERRDLVLGQPLTPPIGAGDPRAALFEDNFYQVSQGGRLFTWYGCGDCHNASATGYRKLR